MDLARLGMFVDIIHCFLEYEKEITTLLHIQFSMRKLLIKLKHILNSSRIKNFSRVTPHPRYHLIQGVFISVDAPYNIIQVLAACCTSSVIIFRNGSCIVSLLEVFLVAQL